MQRSDLKDPATAVVRLQGSEPAFTQCTVQLHVVLQLHVPRLARSSSEVKYWCCVTRVETPGSGLTVKIGHGSHRLHCLPINLGSRHPSRLALILRICPATTGAVPGSSDKTNLFLRYSASLALSNRNKSEHRCSLVIAVLAEVSVWTPNFSRFCPPSRKSRGVLTV